MKRLFVATVAALLLVVAGCTDDDDEAVRGRPCEVLTHDDAADLVGRKLEQVPISELVEDAAFEGADARRQAADARTCIYIPRGTTRNREPETLVAVQLDRNVFGSEREFRAAHSGDLQPLRDVGRAALIERLAEHRGFRIIVLVDDEHIVTLQAQGRSVQREAVISLVQTINERLN